MSIRMSSSTISMSPASSRSGATITCAKLVWRRCAWSNGLRRTRRCLPRSALRIPYAFSPRTVKVADLIPYSSPGLDSITSVLRPRCSAQRRYMRSSISAQSCASVPPASGLDRHDRVARVVLAGEERVLLQPRELAAHVAQHGLELLVRERAHALAQELDVRDELVIALELLLSALVLGGEQRGALLVVPEVGLGELLFQLADSAAQRGGVKGNHGPSRAGPRSPRAGRRAGSGSRRPSRRPS